jgi:circadian clock protein KaiA
MNLLSSDRYEINRLNSSRELLNYLEENKEKIDCLILLNHSSLLPTFNQLYERGTLLPAILLDGWSELEDVCLENDAMSDDKANANAGEPTFFYHSAEIRLPSNELEQIVTIIERAIAQFLHLGPSCFLTDKPKTSIKTEDPINQLSFLLLQQRRLAEKLKERLGYLGVYYKRNAKAFYRNLSSQDKRSLVQQLSEEYREIIINYFVEDFEVNRAIDSFVSHAFFADLSASQVLEIHMELMDEFSQQLKLEGRSEEILMDYRLALIDILAHLGEMYRRSIPRDDIPFELLYQVD